MRIRDLAIDAAVDDKVMEMRVIIVGYQWGSFGGKFLTSESDLPRDQRTVVGFCNASFSTSAMFEHGLRQQIYELSNLETTDGRVRMSPIA